MTTSAETIIVTRDEKETAKINGIRRVGGGGGGGHISQKGRSNSPSCVSVKAQERRG